MHWLRIMLTCIVHTTKCPQLKRVLGNLGGGPGGQGEVSMEEYHTSIHAWLRRLEEPDNVKTMQ